MMAMQPAHELKRLPWLGSVAPPGQAHQLSRLLWLAIVVLSVRCIRRAHSLYSLLDDHRHKEGYERLVDDAIKSVENYAMVGGRHFYSTQSVVNRINSAAIGAGDATEAARAVAQGIESVLRALSLQDNDAILDLELAMHIAAQAAQIYGVATEFEAATVADFQMLLALELGSYPDDGKIIDPSESGPLGPLWPSGRPRGLGKYDSL